MTFTDRFPGGKNVRDRATIVCEVDGISYLATIRADKDAGAPDKIDDGFWPSLDPNDAGWIGDNPTIPYEDQMRYANMVMSKYKRGAMVYCGIAVTAWKAGAPLVGEFDAALWSIDINWPGSDNRHLTSFANELLPHCIAKAKPALERKIADLKRQLAQLES